MKIESALAETEKQMESVLARIDNQIATASFEPCRKRSVEIIGTLMARVKAGRAELYGTVPAQYELALLLALMGCNRTPMVFVDVARQVDGLTITSLEARFSYPDHGTVLSLPMGIISHGENGIAATPPDWTPEQKESAIARLQEWQTFIMAIPATPLIKEIGASHAGALVVWLAELAIFHHAKPLRIGTVAAEWIAARVAARRMGVDKHTLLTRYNKLNPPGKARKKMNSKELLVEDILRLKDCGGIWLNAVERFENSKKPA